MTPDARALRETSLLKAALSCFETDQWESVSVAHIARQAGVAKGTFYLHFASKQEIYARLALESYQRVLRQCVNIQASDSSTRLRSFIRTALEHNIARPEYRRVMQYCQREDFRSNLDPELAKTFIDQEEQFRSMLAEILTRGLQDGSWNTPVSVTLPGICCTISGALNQMHCDSNNEDKSQMEFITSVTDYIVSGVEHCTKVKSDTNRSLRGRTSSHHLTAGRALEDVK